MNKEESGQQRRACIKNGKKVRVDNKRKKVQEREKRKKRKQGIKREKRTKLHTKEKEKGKKSQK